MESKASVASVKWLFLAILLVCSYTFIEASANAKDRSSNSLNKTDTLPVTIYYEALCSDSMVFITNQLYPFWLRHEKEMKLRLVPFGKAWVEEQPNEPPKFHCQHGPRECQLNILHGCILQKLPPKKAFTVVACLMKNFRTDFEQCIEGHESFKNAVVNCSQGPQGGSLFKKFANETDSVYRPLPFVPTIVGDQPYDFYEQDDWLQHFERKFVERYEAKFGVKL
ncbi:GILT-like protein 2 [Anopheles marshallii]|uniref:GILT-like protein 2 n=1 Tax=Anopheles marshallii TaxID=1521116 RepID=UPI00237BB365|nr:GILT-like protein 2 [Anopheles marshallii]